MKEKGITLVEIIIAVFIAALFSAILISDFPRIIKHYSLSKSAYKLAQDIRRIQDLGLSGFQITDEQGNSIGAKGYGVYLSLMYDQEYIIYADMGGDGFDQKYDNDRQSCFGEVNSTKDCVMEIINIGQENPDLKIKEIKIFYLNFMSVNNVSINFAPPDPTTSIFHSEDFYSEVGIVLGLKSYEDASKTVWVNSAGLIRVE
jgi:hypothetical protein